MALRSSIVDAFNFEGWYTGSTPNPPFTVGPPQNDSDNAEVFRPYLQKLYDKGVRYIRTGITDAVQFGGGQADQRLPVMKSIGFNVQYGPSFLRSLHGNVLCPRYLAETWFPVVLGRFPALMALNSVDIFTLGNEHDEGILAEPVVSLSRTSNVVTATFADDHYYKVGDTVAIAGATPSDMNTTAWSLSSPGTGAIILSVPTSKTFTYSAAGADGVATGTITAKMTIETHIRCLKDMAITLRAEPSCPVGLEFVYTFTENPTAIYAAEGLTPGTDFDYWGLNTYGSSATNLTDFRNKVQTLFDGVGTDMMITELNTHFNWETGFSQLPTVAGQERAIKDRISICEDIGVPRVYFFKADSEPRSNGWSGAFETMNYLGDMGPRTSYYAIFSEHRSHLIDGVSRSSIIRNLSTPIHARKYLKRPLDRGKCIDFDQSNSYLIGNYPAAFTAADMPNYTVAVRLYPRTTGGAAVGRIVSGVNQKFLELYTSSSGYTVESWFTSTVARINSGGPITFNKWQTVFVTYRGGQGGYTENFPRIYIDAIEKTNLLTSKSGVRGDSVGQTFSIGNRSDLIRGYDGLMDDLFFWNRVLTVKEMHAFMNGYIPGQYVCGYYMDEASGLVIDQIAGGSDLTLTNASQNIASFTR